MPRTTIVIPTYNERENITPLVTRIAALGISECEVLIVDDNSPDGTGALAEELANRYAHPTSSSAPRRGGVHPRPSDRQGVNPCPTTERSIALRVLHRTRKEGLGAAYVAGFRDALAHGAEIIVQMDADGSHDPAEIPRMLALLTTHDLVVGSRRVRGGRIVGWAWHRRLASFSAQWFARAILGFQTRDVTSGFRAWRAKTLRAALDDALPTRGYAFQETMLAHAERSGVRIVEHPITFLDRATGQSKLGWSDIVEFFHVTLYTRRHDGALPRRDGIITWFRLPRSERRFALGVAIALILLTGLPYLYGWLRTPPGYTFTGIGATTPGDQHVYYSYIEQVRDGAFAFRDLYTSEESARMVQPAWLMVGIFARMTGWSAPVAFHIARLLLIIPFTMFLAVFVATFLREPFAGTSPRTLRRVALLLIAFGLGTGALLGWAILPSFPYESDHWPMDFWIPEAFVFLSVHRSPHFILSLWCMLATYLAIVRHDETRRIRYIIHAMIAAGLLVAIHPYYLPSIPAILIAYALVRMLQERKVIPHLIVLTTAIGGAMLPTFTYWILLSTFDPVHAARAAQNVLPTADLWSIALSYGFLGVFGFLGLLMFLRRRTTRSAPTVFLCTWTVVNVLFLYAPFDWQRRFVQGFSVALALLTTYALAGTVAFARKRMPRRWQPFCVTSLTAWVVAVPIFGASTLADIGREFANYTLRFPTRSPRETFYYPTTDLDAMRWLRAHTPPRAITLTPPGVTGNFFPGWTGRMAYSGHEAETAHFVQKTRDIVTALHPTTSVDTQREFFRRAKIDFAFAPSSDPSRDAFRLLARRLNWSTVYDREGTTIYRVQPE